MTTDEMDELQRVRADVQDLHADQRRMWALAQWAVGTFGVGILVAMVWVGGLSNRVDTLESTDVRLTGTLERLARVEAILERIERRLDEAQ